MSVLVYEEERFRRHDTGPHHPERPARLDAVRTGLERSGVADALVQVAARRAEDHELELVHPAAYIAGIERFCAAGGGHVDADTVLSLESAEIGRFAVGAGLDAVDRLVAGEGDAAFLAVRPPGHHATATRSMGFCVYNSAAVTAAALAARGERVIVVDVDAHHGNGTQDVFYDRGDVAYVSWHQDPLYPGTGRSEQWGRGAGVGSTLNLPMPPGATGEHYRRAIEEVVAPFSEQHGTTWLVLSVGFDGHRADPLCDLALTSGDFGDITGDLLQLVGPGRVVAFLEGGYDLAAVADSTAATVAAMVGERNHPERPSSGGPGEHVVAEVQELRRSIERP